MGHKVFFYFCFFVLLINNGVLGQYNIEAFTHPISDINHTVSIYSDPDMYLKELKSDTEAGWIIKIKEKKGNYFKINIDDLKLYDIWIHLGDIGVVVQNYDSIAIPVYIEADTTSLKYEYIYYSCIGLVYDISEKFLFLQIIEEEKNIYGWIERKYLCGSPYTTCN